MRRTNEQLQEILRRAGEVREIRRLKRLLAANAALSLLFAALLGGVFTILPRLKYAVSQDAAGEYGSLLLQSPAAGYAVVCLLAFALGVCVTYAADFRRQIRQRERGRR